MRRTKTLQSEQRRPHPAARGRIEKAAGSQERQPSWRFDVLHEVAEMVWGRAKRKQALDFCVARIWYLRKSVELGASELERRKDGCQ
jgi:hypothetical protein